MQGASKGNAVDRILKKLADEGNAPDFVLCIGDDRSDEDMFIAMEHVTFSPHLPAEVCPQTPGSQTAHSALACSCNLAWCCMHLNHDTGCCMQHAHSIMCSHTHLPVTQKHNMVDLVLVVRPSAACGLHFML